MPNDPPDDTPAGSKDPLGAEALLTKILRWIVPGLGVVFTGGASWQVFSGEYYGSMLFTGMQSALDLTVPTRHLLQGDLYRSWSQELVTVPLGLAPGLWSVLALPLVFVPVFHVFQKAGATGTARWRVLYTRWYGAVTTVGLAGIAVAAFTVTQAFWLMALALALVIPSLLYLFFYRNDVVKGAPLDRFAVIAVLILLVGTLAFLPYVFGRRAFDLRLRPVLALDSGRTATNTFVFDEPNMVLGRVTPRDTGFSIVLFAAGSGAPISASDVDVSLRGWVRDYRQLPAVDTTNVLADFTSQLQTISWTGGRP